MVGQVAGSKVTPMVIPQQRPKAQAKQPVSQQPSQDTVSFEGGHKTGGGKKAAIGVVAAAAAMVGAAVVFKQTSPDQFQKVVKNVQDFVAPLQEKAGEMFSKVKAKAVELFQAVKTKLSSNPPVA